MTTAPTKAHPVALAVLGFFFGLFFGLFLVFLGLVAIDSVMLEVLPVAFAAAGLVMGLAGRAALKRAGAVPTSAPPLADVGHLPAPS